MPSIYFPNTALLQNLPLSRAAYSHRTAWILAAMSWLAYQRMPGESNLSLDQVVKRITQAAKDNSRSQIRELLVRYKDGEDNIDSHLLKELEQAGFSFIQGFDSGRGTQAFLAQLKCTAGEQPMLILAFRGTETKSVDDIKTDAKVALMEAAQGGRVHPGFYKGFACVQDEIQAALDQYPDSPLYITGHSLGGALAVVATRYLTHPKSAATYTFGGPRVGDDSFFADFRIPVYRVVNAADVVARLPFGQLLTVTLGAIKLIPINGTAWIANWLRNKIAGYTHTGSSIYLSDSLNTLPDATGIAYTDLVVKQDPDFVWKTCLILTRFRRGGFKAFVNDHDIGTYTQKLYSHAQRRNQC